MRTRVREIVSMASARLAIAVAATMILSACGGAAAPQSAGPVTIKVLVPSSGLQSGLDAVAKNFEQANADISCNRYRRQHTLRNC